MAQDKMNLPLYVVPQGNFLLDTDFNFGRANRDGLDANGQRNNEYDISQMSLTNQFRVGLGGGLDIGVNVNYWLQDEIERTPINTSGDIIVVNSTGVEELGLNVRYRLPFEISQGMVTNIDVNLTPSFSTAESAEIDNDGNQFFGGHRASVDLSTGMVSQSFSWRATLAVDWNGSQESEPASSSTVDENVESSLDYGLEAEFVSGLTENFYIGGELSYTMIGAQEEYDPTQNTEPTTEDGSFSIIKIGLKSDIFFSENFAFNFGIGYQMIGERDTTNLSSGNVTGTLDSGNQLDANAGILLLF